MTIEETAAKEAADEAAESARVAAEEAAALAEENSEEAKEAAKVAARQSDLEAKAAEADALRAENLALKARPAAPVADQPLTDEQWASLEEQTGMPRKQIEATWNMAQTAAGKARAEVVSLRTDLAVERAKKAEQRADPAFGKLEKWVDEYLADVSDADKADPAKLAKHMGKAKLYAKGAAREADPNSRVPGSRVPPPPGGKVLVNVDKEEGATMKEEVFEDPHRGIRLTVRPRVSDAYRKKNAHPDVEGGVMIRDRDEWDKGAVFSAAPKE